MQGFQCMVEDLTGFGHFTYELLQLLGDDYPRSPIKLYALRMSQQAASPPVRPHQPKKISCSVYAGQRFQKLCRTACAEVASSDCLISVPLSDFIDNTATPLFQRLYNAVLPAHLMDSSFSTDV